MESRKGRGAELKSACSGSIAAAGRNEHRCVSVQIKKEPAGVDGFIAILFFCSATENISTLEPLPVPFHPAGICRSNAERGKVPMVH